MGSTTGAVLPRRSALFTLPASRWLLHLFRQLQEQLLITASWYHMNLDTVKCNYWQLNQVHIHAAGDAGNAAIAGVLPHIMLIGEVQLGSKMCHPDLITADLSKIQIAG